MANLGFIGLGIMGRPQAGHLQAAGNQLYLNTRSKIPQELLDRGGIACRTHKEVAEKSDIVFVMVSDTPDVEEIMAGPRGVIEGRAILQREITRPRAGDPIQWSARRHPAPSAEGSRGERVAANLGPHIRRQLREHEQAIRPRTGWTDGTTRTDRGGARGGRAETRRA